MKFFSDCSGECAVCGAGSSCLAGHDDDNYFPAKVDQVLERLARKEYRSYEDLMVHYLKTHGLSDSEIKSRINDYRKKLEDEEKTKVYKVSPAFDKLVELMSELRATEKEIGED